MLADEKIIKRILQGRKEAFRELMLRYQDRVFKLAYGFLGRRDDAEDVVQETFVRVYRSLASYSERGAFWPWVRRIAVNCCLNHISSTRPVEKLDESTVPSGEEVDPVGAEVFRRMAIEDVLRAMDGLPDAYRVALALRYIEELSCREIADLTGEPVETVQVRLCRARKALARLAVVNDEVL